MSVMGPIGLNDWHREYPDFTVGGSLYAVQPGQRVQAAELLAGNRCRVHVDVIIGHDGANRGVTWEELQAVRDAVPTARVDLHLIFLHGSTPDDEAQALQVAASHAMESLAINGGRAARHLDWLTRLRSDGVLLLEELPPETTAPVLDGRVDGALVMFIAPGTKDTADLGQLDKVQRLARALPVAVDGGVTRAVAHESYERGAGYLISGRDLFRTTKLATAHAVAEHKI